MTDKVSILTVALEIDIRSDDIQPIIDAIKQLRGVLDVAPNIVDASQWLAEERAKNELGRKVLTAIYPDFKFGV